MCGRYSTTFTMAQLKLQFGAEPAASDELASKREPDAVAPRYNVAPTTRVPVIVARNAEDTRLVENYRWGLVPFWAKDIKIGSQMINARAETIAEKPAFRDALRRRRCIVPAGGFYEWDKVGGIGDVKQPYYFRPAGDTGPAFGFAGLWETWRPERDAEPVHTCTIVTTEANDIVGAIHDRMPVILDPAAIDIWLDPGIHDPSLLRQLLQSYPNDRMERIAVSTRVNSVRNDDNGLIEPIVNSA